MLFQEGCGWHQCHINSDQAVDVQRNRPNQNHSKLRVVVGWGKSNLSNFFFYRCTVESLFASNRIISWVAGYHQEKKNGLQRWTIGQ